MTPVLIVVVVLVISGVSSVAAFFWSLRADQIDSVEQALKRDTEAFGKCQRCGDPVRYEHARYCGATCTALAEAGR